MIFMRDEEARTGIFCFQLEEDRVGHPGDLQSSSGCATANTSQGNGGDAPKVANVYDDNM